MLHVVTAACQVICQIIYWQFRVSVRLRKMADEFNHNSRFFQFLIPPHCLILHDPIYFIE